MLSAKNLPSCQKLFLGIKLLYINVQNICIVYLININMYLNFDEFPSFTFFRYLGKMESVWLDGKMDNDKAVYALKTLFCRGYNSGKKQHF